MMWFQMFQMKKHKQWLVSSVDEAMLDGGVVEEQSLTRRRCVCQVSLFHGSSMEVMWEKMTTCLQMFTSTQYPRRRKWHESHRFGTQPWDLTFSCGGFPFLWIMPDVSTPWSESVCGKIRWPGTTERLTAAYKSSHLWQRQVRRRLWEPSCCLKVPTVASIILMWKKFRTIRILLRAECW